MSIVDEAGQTQLHYLASQAHRAMAADTVVLVVSKPNHEAKRLEVGCGICAPIAPGEKREESMARIEHLIVELADTLLRESSGGKRRLLVQDPDGQIHPATPDARAEKTTMEFTDGSAGG